MTALALACPVLTMKADPATNQTLCDLQSATNSPAREVVNDAVMGAYPQAGFQVLPLNPAKINSVGFLISDKQASPFRPEIGWIKASSAQP